MAGTCKWRLRSAMRTIFIQFSGPNRFAHPLGDGGERGAKWLFVRRIFALAYRLLSRLLLDAAADPVRQLLTGKRVGAELGRRPEAGRKTNRRANTTRGGHNSDIQRTIMITIIII